MRLVHKEIILIYTNNAASESIQPSKSGTNDLQIRNNDNNGYGTIVTDKYKIINGGGILSSNGKTFFTISEGGSNGYAIGVRQQQQIHTLKIFSAV